MQTTDYTHISRDNRLNVGDLVVSGANVVRVTDISHGHTSKLFGRYSCVAVEPTAFTGCDNLPTVFEIITEIAPS